MKLSALRRLLEEIAFDSTTGDPEIVFWIKESSFGTMSPDDHDIDYSSETPRSHREPDGTYSLPLKIIRRK